MHRMLLVLIIGLLAVSNSTGEESSARKKELLNLLSKGIKDWNEWRNVNPNIEIDLSGAFLYHSTPDKASQVQFGFEEMPGGAIYASQFQGANFASANLKDTCVMLANLTDANLRDADLTNAAMFRTDLENADLRNANLSRASMLEANLTSTNLTSAELPGAQLSHANLTNADLTRANLKNTSLYGANLANANLRDTVFNETDLRFSNLDNALFEPKTLTDARLMVGARGLRNLRVTGVIGPDETVSYDIGAIVGLRKLVNDAGLRGLERDLTCAIERIRNGNPDRPFYARFMYYVAFDLTCEYGAEPIRPFLIMLLSALSFSGIYALLLMFSRTSQLRVDFVSNQTGDELSVLLFPRKLPVIKQYRGRLGTLLKYFRFPRIVLYFSIQSAFNIGYREFHIGSWLVRLQRRQYTMRARGPLRAVSGFQSLLGVYLLALWILCTFGRPFG